MGLKKPTGEGGGGLSRSAWAANLQKRSSNYTGISRCGVRASRAVRWPSWAELARALALGGGLTAWPSARASSSSRARCGPRETSGCGEFGLAAHRPRRTERARSTGRASPPWRRVRVRVGASARPSARPYTLLPCCVCVVYNVVYSVVHVCSPSSHRQRRKERARSSGRVGPPWRLDCLA